MGQISNSTPKLALKSRQCVEEVEEVQSKIITLTLETAIASLILYRASLRLLFVIARVQLKRQRSSFAFEETRAMAIANMVLGLKELHIRGEIRTNVDYTVDILHAPKYTPEYKDNKIHTGWLDSRIAMRVRAERPLP